MKALDFYAFFFASLYDEIFVVARKTARKATAGGYGAGDWNDLNA